jgi:hypothetical protein
MMANLGKFRTCAIDELNEALTGVRVSGCAVNC